MTFWRIGGLAIGTAMVALVVGLVEPPPALALDPSALGTLRGVLKEHDPSVKAVLVLRGNCSLFEFYKAGTDADTRLPLHSMTKSVLSALVGLAIDQGDLGLDQTLGDLLPEVLAPGIDARIRTVRIRQLLTMTAGLDAEAKPPRDLSLAALWRWSLTRPFLSVPGQAFRYDNFGANLLSVILSRRIHQSAQAYARKNLFGPMGISNEQWLDDGDGHSVGAYGLWLTARDMAKIGLLYLRHGHWNGEQLVPAGFVAESTRRHNEGGPPFYAAYGYLWWVTAAKTGQNAFFAAGSDGQVIYVVPKLDLVVVLASEKSPPGGAAGVVNDVILPAVAAMPSRSCGGMRSGDDSHDEPDPARP